MTTMTTMTTQRALQIMTEERDRLRERRCSGPRMCRACMRRGTQASETMAAYDYVVKVLTTIRNWEVQSGRTTDRIK